MKFSIRDLLLATVIVALIVGWWLDRTRLAKKSTVDETRIGDLEERIVKLRETISRTMSEKRDLGKRLTTLESESRLRSMPNELPSMRTYTIPGPPVPDPSAPAPNPPNP